MDSLGYLKNFEFRCSEHSKLQAHVAFEHANGKSIAAVAIEFGIPAHHVIRFYRRICRHIYREIGWHIRNCEEFSEFEKTIILCSMDEVLHDTTFRHPIGIKLIEKYYLFICEQSKNHPEAFKNWMDKVEKVTPSQDEINRKKINQLLARLKTRHDNLISNAESEYQYLINLIQDIIEPKSKPIQTELIDYKPRYDMMASQNMAAQESGYVKFVPIPLKSDELDELGLPVRLTNCLKCEGIYFIKDLVSRTALNLLKMPNLGGESLRKIKESLSRHGLYLKESDDESQ